MGARVDFVPEGLEATQIMVLGGSPAAAAFGQAANSSYVARDTGGGYDFASAMFSFNGRLRRQHFWISWLILFGAGFVTGLIPIIGGLIGLVLIWPNVAITVKRLHDMGKTGWFAVIPWVANIVGIVMIISAVGMSIITNPQAFENEDPSAVLAMFGSMMGGIAVLFLPGQPSLPALDRHHRQRAWRQPLRPQPKGRIKPRGALRSAPFL